MPFLNYNKLYTYYNIKSINKNTIGIPIGGESILKTHNTFPAMSQKYHVPMWEVPFVTDLDDEDKSTINGNRSNYEETKKSYISFATDLLKRLNIGESHE